MTSTPLDLGRPVAGDVVELILDDHRRFETLLRQLRDAVPTATRSARRSPPCTWRTPRRRRSTSTRRCGSKRAIDADEAEHSEEEHAEGNQALLAVLELKGTDTQAFDDAVEKLAEAVNHHLTEEELTILNPAREEVSEAARADLGLDFVTERNAQLDADCGRIEQRPGHRGPRREGGPARRERVGPSPGCRAPG